MHHSFVRALIIWITIFSATYLYFNAKLEPRIRVAKQSQVSGEVAIPRSWDGHYYIQGSINGYPVIFMVDTGATFVSLGSEIARRAQLPKGRPANFTTAGGIIQGEMVSDQTVEAGGIVVSSLQISVGLPGDMALLGQNFLRNIDVFQSNDTMTLRLRQQ
jgi:aspartyl protease family protein